MNSRIKKISKKKKLNQTNLRENKISLLLILNIIISYKKEIHKYSKIFFLFLKLIRQKNWILKMKINKDKKLSRMRNIKKKH